MKQGIKKWLGITTLEEKLSKTSEPSEKASEPQSILNGYENIGKTMEWVQGRLTPSEFLVFYEICKRTIGVPQTATELLSYRGITESTGLSFKTIKIVVPTLINKNYIIKIGTNCTTNTSKLPCRYQLSTSFEDFPTLKV